MLAHQGLHGNVSSVELAHIIREIMEQGYAVIAPDYRGSTGYGQGFYNQVDYGGREVDDVLAGKAWMLEKYSFLDPKRVGATGWSHGGLVRGGVCGRAGQRPGAADGLRIGVVSGAVFGGVSHREVGAGRYQGV